MPKKIPSAATPPVPLLTHRGVVYPWQCDHVGHMNVMWYVSKFDEATWSLFTAIGVTPSYVREQRRGMAAVHQSIDYMREVLPGDALYVRSWVVEVREKVIRFVHEMINAEKEEVAARTELTAVHLDLVKRKSCPFPKEIIEKALALRREEETP